MGRLTATKMAGKLTLSLLPKFKSNDVSPIMSNILLRGSDMSYYPICRLNLTGTAMNGKIMKILINTILDDRQYKYLTWLNLTQTGLSSKLKKKKKKKKNEEEDEKEDGLERLDLCSLLAVGLKKNKSLKYLFLSKNPSIDADGFDVILQSISKHPSLRCLRYNTNQMTMGHAQVLSKWFATNPSLPQIGMEHSNINDLMFIEMMKGLAQNNTVFDLNVAKNSIGDEGIEALSKMVLMNEKTNIMRLILFENDITAKGAQYLSDALAKNWTICELNLSNQSDCKFDDEAVNILCNGLKYNESLHTLRMGNNGLSSDCCLGLGELLKVHPNLSKLEVFLNKAIGGKGFQLLAKGLESNSRLKLLNFSETSPGKDGGKALKDSLLKQYKNTKKMIEETTKSLKECAAIKHCINDNDVDEFSNDLIHEIVSNFIGYSVLKQLDIKNCYISQNGEGIDDIVFLRSVLQKQGHDLRVVW